MVFGITITTEMIIAGGVALFGVIVFQVLQGKRKIKFKGPLHMKVHRWTAYALIALALGHAMAGLAYMNVIGF